ncbi:MAG: hypothetical protein ACKVWR_20175 [Acidimicrobiales bacterium]
MEATSLQFAGAVHLLAERSRGLGLVMPAFRSPPRLVGVERSLRRRSDGGATVAVRIRGRPWAAVLADMIEGVVAANRLAGAPADACRSALWAEVTVETRGAA